LQSARLLLRGSAGLSEWRPQYLSNTTTPAPGGRRRLLAGAAAWSGSVRMLGAASPGIVALVLLAGLVAPLVGLRRSSRHSSGGTQVTRRGMLAALSVLSLAAVSQFVTVLLGDGAYELVKHLLLFDLLWGATAVGLMTWGPFTWQRPTVGAFGWTGGCSGASVDRCSRPQNHGLQLVLARLCWSSGAMKRSLFAQSVQARPASRTLYRSVCCLLAYLLTWSMPCGEPTEQ